MQFSRWRPIAIYIIYILNILLNYKYNYYLGTILQYLNNCDFYLINLIYYIIRNI